MTKRSLAWLAMTGLVLVATPALAQESLDGPWASPFGGMNGTARASFPVIFPPGGDWEVAWAIDPNSPGSMDFRVPSNPSQIVFDAEGNLYWHSQGHWSDTDHVASCTPSGQIRWVGPPGGIGHMQTDLSPIVGQAAVYMVGMFDPDEYDPNDPCLGFTSQQIFALSKIDGSVIWRIKLDNEPECPEGPDPITNNAQPNPMLYDGRLFVMGLPKAARGVSVYQIDAATGAIRGNNIVPQIEHKMCGNTVLLPDKFGAGVHGLYTLVYDQDPAQLVCVAVDTNTNTASWVWESSGIVDGAEIGGLWWGSHSHVIYNETYDRIYTYTEDNSYGYDFFSFDPLIGDDWRWWGDAGDWWMTKGMYQTGALDFDDTRMLNGCGDGGFAFFEDDGDGNLAFTESIHHLVWDHPRQFVQLLYDTDTDSTVAVTASSGMGTGMTHVYMCDLDDRTPPAEDGPTYIDDVEVYQGPDVDHLTLVWSEDFEGYSAGGPPGSAWTTSYGGDQPEPVVLDDPTDSGQGRLLAFDPVIPSEPNNPDAWWGHGAFIPFTQTTGNVVVTKYRQWRKDTSEVYEVMWGQDADDYTRGYAYTHDWDSRICTLEWLDAWSQPNYQIDERWEDVMFVYDFGAETATVKVADRAEVTSSWVDEPAAPDDSAAGFGITMWHGDVSDNFPRIRVNHLQDVRDAWLGVNLRGGPVVGPDGKIYYFEAHTGWEPPSQHAGWLFAIQPATGCVADIDGDGDTDLSDLAALLAGYLTSTGDPNYNPAADFDDSGTIDLSDLAFLLADYNCGT